ncbi:MAG TPA: glutathione S-transferase N-terminal domain-containing protein [Polyangiaceae bacterium]|jgi:GST-like protein|nr:glutathione S-transferase N-terminal domain-containing protein [Polyangiaceae bacterium]
MIELYTWTTPNGVKPLIMLEETGLPHHVTAVDIGKGAQHAPDFVRINPNAKIPAMIDDGVRIFESGAILIHLAEKAGGKFLPPSGQARADVLGWLFFQIGSVGPMFGQLGHFRGAKLADGYALDRFTKEVERLADVMNTRLGEVDCLGGEYSIADIATIGWARGLGGYYKFDMTRWPNLQTWIDRVVARPAVARALAWKP